MGTNLVRGPEVLFVFAITFALVLFPLASVVGGTIVYMIEKPLPIWATILSGIVIGVFAIAIWLTIIGFILGKIGGKK